MEPALGLRERIAVEVELGVRPDIVLARADLLREIHALEARELACGLDRRVDVDVAGHQRAVLRAAIAQQARQLAGVDVGDRDDALLGQPARQRQLRAPVARTLGDMADDQSGRPDALGFVVLGRGAGVANVRIRQRDDLPRVRRIGHHLLVAGHGRVEHDFANGQAGCADRTALEEGAVFEREDCGLGHGGSPVLPRDAEPCMRRIAAAENRGRGA